MAFTHLQVLRERLGMYSAAEEEARTSMLNECANANVGRWAIYYLQQMVSAETKGRLARRILDELPEEDMPQQVLELFYKRIGEERTEHTRRVLGEVRGVTGTSLDVKLAEIEATEDLLSQVYYYLKAHLEG